MVNFINNQISDSIHVKNEILQNDKLLSTIEVVIKKCVEVYRNGFKTLIAGNGGSAADAQHIAGEFVSKFYFDRPGLPSIALSTDTSIITSIGNDYGFDKLFSRQIQANGQKGDMFIGISTSGNSPNILNGFRVAKDLGIVTVGLTGMSGGLMEDLCDYSIKAPSTVTPRIQESHIMIGHILCAAVEAAIFGELV